MVALLREQLQELSLHRSFTLEEKIVTVIAQDRVINENLKRQIKNRTLITCRLFLLINFETTYKKPPFKVAIFPDVVLV